MAVLADIYFKAEKLQELLNLVHDTGAKGVALTVNIKDEQYVDDYGQNVSAYVSQSKADSESRKPKQYCGNGKVFWTNGDVYVPPRRDRNAPDPAPARAQAPYRQRNELQDDLPF